MKKNYLLLLLSIACAAGKVYAQSIPSCATDEMHKRYKAQNPDIAIYEKQLEASIQNYINAQSVATRGARTTAGSIDTNYLEIPVVVHVVHNYGAELLKDNQVYELIKEMNLFYSKQNNQSGVIQPFKQYIGNPKIRFHLASIDPNGNLTNGITHRHSYTTYGYDDQAKMDQWPQSNYFNIWFEDHIGLSIGVGTVLAYATLPASSVGNPSYDGVIAGYQWIDDGGTDGGSTLDHETGHYLNLQHPWNSSGKNVEEACGDDGVDDTPPTKGHFSCGVSKLYDTACAINYFKIYPDTSIAGYHLENYPDTTNTQNVMDYSGDCTNMVTKGQVDRMRATLRSNVAYRSTLCDSTNLANTGIGTYNPATQSFVPFSRKDLKPNPEFAAMTSSAGFVTASNYMDKNCYYTFPGSDLKFVNESWNDTVTSITWTFTNGATVPTQTQANPTMGTTSVTTKFTEPGWVTVSLKATGNNSGDTTASWNRAVYVADNAGQPGIGYFQEFTTADTAKWPMFNYYNNNLRWKMADIGYHDNQCVQYAGFDDRILQLTGNPRGDYDDLFSIPMDLSGYGSGPCSLNFYYSGASRSASSININDTLLIQYTINKGASWVTMATLAKGELCNAGAVATSYKPTSKSDWKLFSMNVPATARTSYTNFRFRYKPGTSLVNNGTTYVPGYQSSGNNFYMDRITFSPYPAGLNDLSLSNGEVAVMPNPTSGNAYVVVKDAGTGSANISVTDITGKVVYTTVQQLLTNQTMIEIPQSVISVNGMYLVHVVTGSNVNTVKLVVQ